MILFTYNIFDLILRFRIIVKMLVVIWFFSISYDKELIRRRYYHRDQKRRFEEYSQTMKYNLYINLSIFYADESQ